MAGINPNNGSSPLGDDFVSITVTSEIVPVRIINTNALDVRVMNFPGVPPPIPGLKQSPYIPKLPGQKEEVIPQSRDVGGMVAAIAIGGILLKGLSEVKATFIDPLLGAAKGGIDSGIQRGAQTEVLGKSFQVLGAAIGVHLLPVVIRLASSAMAVANNFDKLAKDSIFGKVLSLGGDGNSGDKGWTLDEVTRVGIRNATFTTMGPLKLAGLNPDKWLNKQIFGFSDENIKKVDKDQLSMTSLVVQSIRNSIGGQAGYHGISDIRNQAQLAAQQDPIERQIKELQIKALNKYLLENGLGGDWTKSIAIAVAGA